MRIRLALVAALGLVSLACDRSPVGQEAGGLHVPRLRPSFLVEPYSPPEFTECVEGQAYSINDLHISRDDSLLTEYFAPTGSQRPACSGIAFTEALNDPARLVLRFSTHGHQTDWRFMVRQLRRATASSFDTSAAVPKQDAAAAVKHDTVPAPAADGYDLMLYQLSFHNERGADNLPPPGAPAPDAVFQLWANIDTAANLAALIVNGNQPHLTWVNWHKGRSFDSTQVYRRINLTGAWQFIATVDRLGVSYTDGPLPNGTYEYFVRHVTAGAPVTADVPALPRPTGRASRAVRVDVGGAPPGPPIALDCEGNFPPFHSVDCSWQDTVPTAWTQVFRDAESQPRATLAPGVHTWTDTTIQQGSSYTYRFRHVRNGVPGTEASTLGVALPVPPENLSCGGTSPTTASCIWLPKEENADTEIWRKGGPGRQVWSLVGYRYPGQNQFDDTGLSTGYTYTYRVRHVFNPGYYLTDWSNTDTATPSSIPEPYRPGGP